MDHQRLVVLVLPDPICKSSDHGRRGNLGDFGGKCYSIHSISMVCKGTMMNPFGAFFPPQANGGVCGRRGDPVPIHGTRYRIHRVTMGSEEQEVPHLEDVQNTNRCVIARKNHTFVIRMESDTEYYSRHYDFANLVPACRIPNAQGVVVRS